MLCSAVEEAHIGLTLKQPCEEVGSCIWSSAALSDPNNQRMLNQLALTPCGDIRVFLQLVTTHQVLQKDLLFLRQGRVSLKNTRCTVAHETLEVRAM